MTGASLLTDASVGRSLALDTSLLSVAAPMAPTTNSAAVLPPTIHGQRRVRGGRGKCMRRRRK